MGDAGELSAAVERSKRVSESALKPDRVPPFRRREYQLYGFQTKFAGALALMSLFINGTIVFLAYSVFIRGGAPSEGIFGMNRTWFLVGIVGLVIWSSGFFYAFALVQTHRFAGPLALISKWMGELERGRFPKMRNIRESDELQEFSEQFRDIIDGFKKRENEDLQMLNEALADLRSGKAGPAFYRMESLLSQKRQRINDESAPV